MAASVNEFKEVHISIKVPERPVAGSGWTGMYRGSGGGICDVSPHKTDLHLASRDFDMDAATGYRRGPGTAGAHPVCRGEGEHSASFLRQDKGGDLSRSNSCATPRSPPSNQ